MILFFVIWKHGVKGRAIYNYYRIGKNLENLPILLYNADEDTYFIQDRARHEKDRVLSKPSEVMPSLRLFNRTINSGFLAIWVSGKIKLLSLLIPTVAVSSILLISKVGSVNPL
jgi:hypothetical protein